MRTHRFLLAALAAALLLPGLAHAQPARSVFSWGGSRGMLGILTEPIPSGDWNARQRRVVDVVEDSPAAKAGIMVGDTLLSINDLPASSQVMSLPFEPGDTLVLRVRRDGRERDIRVVAAERTGSFAYHVAIPDSIDHTVSVILDRVRALQLDTIQFPRIQIQRLDGDSVDSVIIVNGDTIRTRNMLRLRELRDSAFGVAGVFGPDSNFIRIFPDSIRSFGFYSDSARGWTLFQSDSAWARPFDVLTYSASVGMRAVAGAELTPLNEGLAQYFGATHGVLVLNARPGTPAARAGLRAGDVILQVNDRAVSSVIDLRRAIQRASGDEVTLRVLRNGSNVDVILNKD